MQQCVSIPLKMTRRRSTAMVRGHREAELTLSHRHGSTDPASTTSPSSCADPPLAKDRYRRLRMPLCSIQLLHGAAGHGLRSRQRQLRTSLLCGWSRLLTTPREGSHRVPVGRSGESTSSVNADGPFGAHCSARSTSRRFGRAPALGGLGPIT